MFLALLALAVYALAIISFPINMEESKATPPGILKKSVSGVYTAEEKIRNLEKRVEDYITRIGHLEDALAQMYDDATTEEYTVPSQYTISWMPDNPPRVTQRDREIAIWRTRTKGAVDLYCDEDLGFQ